MQEWFSSHGWVAIIIALVLLYALGLWLGAHGRVVVYRNYYDVLLVAGLYLLPLLLMPLLLLFDDKSESAEELRAGLLIIVFVLEALLLVFVLMRTLIDNRNPLKALLALYVKIPTAVFFAFHLHSAFNGKTAQERRRSMFWSAFMVPVIYALVHDKKTGKLPTPYRRK